MHLFVQKRFEEHYGRLLCSLAWGNLKYDICIFVCNELSITEVRALILVRMIVTGRTKTGSSSVARATNKIRDCLKPNSLGFWYCLHGVFLPSFLFDYWISFISSIFRWNYFFKYLQFRALPPVLFYAFYYLHFTYTMTLTSCKLCPRFISPSLSFCSSMFLFLF